VAELLVAELAPTQQAKVQEAALRLGEALDLLLLRDAQ